LLALAQEQGVALGEVDGRVLVCVFTEHEDGGGSLSPIQYKEI
jgi:hypothetical protein